MLNRSVSDTQYCTSFHPTPIAIVAPFGSVCADCNIHRPIEVAGVAVQTPELLTKDRNAEFIIALQIAGARFLIAGGLAIQRYCPERLADDADLLIEPVLQNAEAVAAIVSQFDPYDISPALLVRPKVQIPSKARTLYIDLLTPAKHESFDDLWSASEPAQIRGTELRVASVGHLIKMKTEAAHSDEAEAAKHRHDLQSLWAVVQ
jgi:hypothetical protein